MAMLSGTEVQQGIVPGIAGLARDIVGARTRHRDRQLQLERDRMRLELAALKSQQSAQAKQDKPIFSTFPSTGTTISAIRETRPQVETPEVTAEGLIESSQREADRDATATQKRKIAEEAAQAQQALRLGTDSLTPFQADDGGRELPLGLVEESGGPNATALALGQHQVAAESAGQLQAQLQGSGNQAGASAASEAQEMLAQGLLTPGAFATFLEDDLRRSAMQSEDPHLFARMQELFQKYPAGTDPAGIPGPDRVVWEQAQDLNMGQTASYEEELQTALQKSLEVNVASDPQAYAQEQIGRELSPYESRMFGQAQRALEVQGVSVEATAQPLMEMVEVMKNGGSIHTATDQVMGADTGRQKRESWLRENSTTSNPGLALYNHGTSLAKKAGLAPASAELVGLVLAASGGRISPTTTTELAKVAGNSAEREAWFAKLKAESPTVAGFERDEMLLRQALTDLGLAN